MNALFGYCQAKLVIVVIAMVCGIAAIIGEHVYTIATAAKQINEGNRQVLRGAQAAMKAQRDYRMK